MSQKIREVAQWLSNFIILNVLWVMGVSVGLIGLGLMPATVAVFAVSRDLINQKEMSSLFTQFLHYYKKLFMQANGYGLLFGIVSYVIYVNYLFVPVFYFENLHVYIYSFLIVLSMVVFMTFINLFSVIVHYDLKGMVYLRYALSLTFVEPGLMIMQLVWIIAYLMILLFLPKVSIFIGISMFCYLLMTINLTRFERIKRKAAKRAVPVHN